MKNKIIELAKKQTGNDYTIYCRDMGYNYRIEQLEKKVDKHNNFAEKIPIINVQIETINHRLDELESEHHND